MGFSDTFSAVYNARIKAADLGLQRDQLRNQTAQVNAQLYKEGWNYDPSTGQMTRNTIGQLSDNNTEAQLKEQNVLLQKIHNKQIAQESANAVAKSIHTGDWSMFNQFIQKNPEVQKAISSMGYTAVRSVNPETDINIIKPFLTVNKETQDFNHDGKVNQADLVYAYQNNIDGFRTKFNKNNLIAINTQGHPELIPTSNLLATTNTLSNLTASDTDIVQKNYNDYVNTIKGLLGVNQAKENYYNAGAEANTAKAFNYDMNTKLDVKKANLIDAQTKKTEATTNIAIKEGNLNILNKQLDTIIKKNNIQDSNAANYVQNNIGKIDITKPVNDKTLANYKMYSDKIGNKQLDPAIKKTLIATSTVYKQGNNLLHFLDTHNIPHNALANIGQLAKKYIGASPEAKLEIRNQWALQAKAGDMISQYLLDMSGQAVTDEEYKRKLNYIFGNDWSTADSLKTHLTSFLKEQKIKGSNEAKLAAKYDPYTGYIYYHMFNNQPTNNQPTNNQPTNNQPTNGKPPLSSFFK